MTHDVQQHMTSRAASTIFAALYPRCPPRDAGATWLAIREWVARRPPRPPIRRFVKRHIGEPRCRGPIIEFRGTGDESLEAPTPVEVPWEGEELLIATSLAAGDSYQVLAAKLGMSPSSLARRVAAMREGSHAQ